MSLSYLEIDIIKANAKHITSYRNSNLIQIEKDQNLAETRYKFKQNKNPCLHKQYFCNSHLFSTDFIYNKFLRINFSTYFVQ